MDSPPKDLDACCQCGWLGMCTIACPLADPAHQISPTISTAPGLAHALDNLAFEITAEENAALENESQDRLA